MAYTVEDAIAAVASAQAAETNFNTVWFIQASVTITDTPREQLYPHPGAHLPTQDREEGAVEHFADEPWTPIKGSGPLFRGYPTPLLGNLNTPLWDADKFKCQRGGGPAFYVGVDIEPVITFVGPVSISPPAFARSLTHRLGLLSRKHYQGVCAFQPQLRFSIQLNEDPANPKLTGTITPDPSLPGAIRLPATIEVVLESLASFTIV